MEAPLNFRRRRGPVFWIATLAVVASAAGLGWYFYSGSLSDAAVEKKPAASARKGKGGFDPNRPTPILAEAARKSDVNVFLNGLGTVVPLRTVTVRSRVEGELLRVNFTEGQQVKAGDLLAEIDPRPFQVQLAQAEGQLVKDQALLANARIDLERYQTLFKQDSIARQQVDTQAALVRQYEGTIRADQAQVDNARLQLTYARITAPISGRLGLRLVDPGNIVRSGDANGVVVITQTQPISAVFTIPQDSLPVVMKRVQSGDKLAVEAWDRENKARLAAGTLITVDNQIDPATGTVKLKAEFANADGALFPNQFVNVRMLVDTRKEVVTVLAAALQRGARGDFVYVVKEDSTVTVRPVRQGPAEGGRVTIESGLQAGELVVTDGVDRLREGAKVEVAQARPTFAPKDGEGRKGGRKKAEK
jgi:multidrug efflux system membrane fusion protein